MTDDGQYFLNEYATRSLRYTADQDYIAARMSYKASLTEPFLWSSLHAIEKYLKATLIFNTVKAKGFRHDVVKLLAAVKKIEAIDLRLPPDVESFINYINEFGENRYFEGQVVLEEYSLDKLDETIWYIRRICYDWKAYEGFNGCKIEPSYSEVDPKEYELSNGLLEEIIHEKSTAYCFLAWNNSFFGKEEYHREEVRRTQAKFSYISSTLSLWGKPAFEVLKEYVDFSYDTKQYFNNQT